MTFNPGAPLPPGDTFLRSQGDRSSSWEFLDIDLSTARSKERLGVFGGSVVFVSTRAWDSESVISATLSTGVAVLYAGRKDTKPNELVPGIVWEFGQFDAKDEWFITNAAQANAMLRIYFSRGPIVQLNSADVTISGNVNTQEQFPDINSVNARSFMGGGIRTATNQAHWQFKNPAASGVTGYLKSVLLTATANMVVSITRHDTDLTTNLAGIVNKTLGGAAPACQLRNVDNATVLGTAIGSQALAIPVIDPVQVIRGGPIIVGEGEGVVFASQTTGIGLRGWFEWAEV